LFDISCQIGAMDLLAPGAPPPFDIWDNTAKYNDIRDRFGKDLSDSQLMLLCDKFYCVDECRSVPLLVHDRPTIVRDKLNDRGDLGSRLGLKKSIESLGLLLDLRRGPFLIETDKVGEYTCAHWATTIEAFYMAYKDPENSENRNVMMSAKAGLPSSKIYHRKIPADAARFLKEYGNQGNDNMTRKTILECYREALRIEVAWQKRKTAMQWTLASLGYAQHETKKWEFACSILPRRWERPRHFEVCLHFARESAKVMITQGEFAGQSVWSALEKKVNSECDLSHPSAANYSYLFTTLYTLFRKLRSQHPDWIVDCCLLFLPVARPLVVCSLLPTGFGTVAVTKCTDTMVDALLTTMEASKVVESALVPAKPTAPRPKASAKKGKKPSARRAAKVTAKVKAKRVAPRLGFSVVGDEGITKQDGEKTFLSLLQHKCDYMLKLDGRQRTLVTSFRFASLVGALAGVVTLTMRGEERPVKGFNKLSKIFKAELYRTAMLQPRLSDPDFLDGAIDDDVDRLDPGDVTTEARSAPVIRTSLEEHSASATALAEFVRSHSLSLPTLAFTCGPTVINNTMLSVFQSLMTDGGVVASIQEASDRLIEATVREVEKVLPPNWDDVGELLGKCSAILAVEVGTEKAPHADAGEVASLLSQLKLEDVAQLKVDKVYVTTLRHRIFFHVLKCLGQQCIQVREGPSVVPRTWLPPLMSQAVTALLSDSETWLPSSKVPDGVNFSTIKLSSGLSFSEFAAAWGTEAANLNQRCCSDVNPLDFERKRTAFVGALNVKNSVAIASLMNSEGITLPPSLRIGKDVDVFPAARATVVSQCIELYDAKHAAAKDTLVCLQNFSSTVLKALQSKFVKSAAMLGAGAAASSAVVDAKGSADSVFTLLEWWTRTAEQEGGTTGPDASLLTREIIAVMNLKFAGIARAAYAGIDGSAPTVKSANLQVGIAAESATKKSSRVVVKREGPPSADFVLDFWGRVVDETTSASLPKATCIPLGDAGGVGPMLYLDGSAAMNCRRSDCCFAWHISPLPAKSNEAVEMAATPEEEDLVLVPATEEIVVPAKRRKKHKQHVATHSVHMVEMIISVGGTLGEFKYERPVLRDIAGIEPVDGRLFRELAVWDLVPRVRASSKETGKGFAQM